MDYRTNPGGRWRPRHFENPPSDANDSIDSEVALGISSESCFEPSLLASKAVRVLVV
jgi:hypothetical protein